jgi:hypothetical protein
MSKKTTKLSPTLKEKIRNLFVQGEEIEQGSRTLYTLDHLAKQYNIGKSTLYRHAKQEQWKVHQEQFQQEYLTELDENRKKELVNESKKFDMTTLNISKALLGQIGQTIKKSQSEDKFTPNLLNTLAEATYKVQRVAKLALGEATENMNLNAKVTDTSAFREAMELLDTVAEQRREVNDKAIH